ncbi:uncharacterized protein [Panulirus ornatus]|uniref:uncharacterized protein n=1 Tax=Panulirus ornatus TaxID=150431 RepID=UPI003A8C375E
MKTFILFLTVMGVVSAQQLPNTLNQNAGAPAATPVGGAAAGPAPAQPNWGPRAYGPGLNNIYALPPHPLVMQRAIQIANNFDALVRVDVDGDVTLTDKFGQEVDIVDSFGREYDI